MIWREMLAEALDQGKTLFTQKDLAKKLKCSTSTIFNALKDLRRLGAIEVTGRFFRIKDREKILLFFATHRNLKKDMLYETHVDDSARGIEGNMPADVIFAAFSAYRFTYEEEPADYDQVYVYSNDLETIKKRFPRQKGYSNLFVLKPDPTMLLSGKKLTHPVQIFVDLWNIPVWYAKDYLKAIKAKLNL